MKKRKKKLVDSKTELINKIHKYNFLIPFNSFYKLKYDNIKSNSWFTINKTTINDINISSFINHNSDSNNNNNDTIIKCKKVTLQPTVKQQMILLNWFEAYRKMYNKTLLVIKQLMVENNKNMFNFRYIRTNKMKEIKQKLNIETKINSHILDGAIKLACSSYKSAVANYKNGNIKKFNIRPIKQAKKSKIMDIEQCYFYEKGFCKQTLGKMLTTCGFNFSEVNKDSKLHYNKITNRFTLLIPVETNCKELNNSGFISIDPGLKTFLTGISNNSAYKIGDNLIDVVKNNITKIDNYMKINNKISRKRIETLKRKTYNRITDLHWKTINYLIKIESVKDILIGNWSTKCISSNSKYLDPIYKRVSSSLRFYEFINKLKFKCNENNINLKLVDESYTSKICSFCKQTAVINNNRTLSCSCNLSLDRDINGCVNILLKSLN
jgi:putative transposase